MKKVGLLFAVALVGFGSAVTYHVFENSIHWFLDAVWYDLFNTDNNRWLIVPLCLVLGLVFFGLQHFLDPNSEKAVEHGLGEAPTPTLYNFFKVVFIGFFSLAAGASLGPEAILVPACLLVGGLVGTWLFKNDKQSIQILTAAGFIALFTAFFNSMLIGVLSLFLLLAQTKGRLKLPMLVVAIVASAASWCTLLLLDGKSYLSLPPYHWRINIETLMLIIILLFAGYGITQLMDKLSSLIKDVRKIHKRESWIFRALFASLVLSVLYLVGGPLVEFTGNKSIVPMFEQASSLGLVGLVWLLIIKIVAIVWSKTIGYRGGMIFPTIFLASIATAIVGLYIKDFNFIYGIIAFVAGTLVANKKTHILA